MNFATKILVTLTVSLALAGAVAVVVMSHTRPNYKTAYEAALQQAEAANAASLIASSDRVVIQPAGEMTLATRDAELVALNQELAALLKTNNADRDQLQLTLTQIARFGDPLGRLEKEAAGLREQLDKSQAEGRRIASLNAKIVKQIQDAEKLASDRYRRAREVEAKNQTLKLQNRSLDDKIQELQARVGLAANP